MKHLKLFESFDDQELDCIEENAKRVLDENIIKDYGNYTIKDAPQLITWIRETFYNKIDLVKSGYSEFESKIDDMFDSSKWSNPTLQLGIASESSYECLFMAESNLIIDNVQDDQIIQSTIEVNSGAKRFMEKVRTMQTRKSSPHSSIIYYPYYKIEHSYRVDNEIGKDVEKSESRYIRYCIKILSDIFPGWRVSVQMRPSVSAVHFWVHLTDKTNVID